jgi:histidine triad (HIT) family protein
MMPDPSHSTARDANCLFCKITAGQIPCHRIYEDANLIAFLDIGPIVRGHTLVVPKAHVINYLDCPPPLAAALAAVMPRICRAVVAATQAEGCHILVNSGAAATQSVMHLHQHILPRFGGDGFALPWPARPLDANQAASLAAAISRAIGP